MIEAAPGEEASPSRAAVAARFCAGSTGSCSRWSPSRLRALGRLGRHALRRPGDESYFVVQRRSPPASASSVWSLAIPRAARPRPPALAPHLRRHPRADGARLRRRRDDSRLEALARPRRHPVPAVRARQGPVRPRARRLPRGARGQVTAGAPSCPPSGSPSGPILLVFLQPDLGTALVYGAALIAVLFFAGVRWRQLLTLLVSAAIVIVSVLWLLPPRVSRC